MEDKMTAFCGLVCTDCGAYIATKNNDVKKRKKVAKSWSKMLNRELKPEDINCDGCLQLEGRLFGYCNECPIRKCGLEKNVKNCAYCEEYECEKLTEFFKMAPTAKESLDKIRKSL